MSIQNRASAVSLLAVAVVVALCTKTYAQNAATDTIFELRPHCENADQTKCPSFPIRDPQNRQTEILSVGQELDMDLIVRNPNGSPIERVRSWLAYDPLSLNGEMLEISDAFPTTTPGEADFSINDGYIKISASTETPITDEIIIVAHIKVRIRETASTNTVIPFYDAARSLSSHTAIVTRVAGEELNIASPLLGFLLVRIGEDTQNFSVRSSTASTAQASSAVATPTSAAPKSSAAAVASSKAPVASSVQSSSAASVEQSSSSIEAVFSLLQVKNLRVTTEGSAVYLAWDALPSSQIVGYNMYYSTVSGKYIQKRSVDRSISTMTIRALPTTSTYYFAIRGVNAANEETDFSKEVGITVGDPRTSTSPLTGRVITDGPQGRTPHSGGNIAGASGNSSTLALLLAGSAIIGTLLAFRRQFSASTAQS